MIFGLGDPDIIPSDDDTNNSNNEKSVISATVCGILIMVSVIIGVHTIRRLKRRSYQRISEFVNNNNNNEDVDTDSSLLSAAAATSALMPPSMIDNHIVEPFQYEKLITPQPNHQLINNNYHNVIINENDYLQNNNMSSVNLNSYPPPYGSITGDY
ncbi:unnamed protein product [Schistosoma turkestanicum]|nr:unnamed protein product [Schistosoma turkestanicum]